MNIFIKKNKYKTNGGAAMLMLVIFAIFISLTIIIGIVTPVVREFAVAKDSYVSKQSYFLAESGVEDAFYRIKNSKQISSSESLVLGTSSTTTTITDIGSSQKEISSLGDTNSFQRKVGLTINTSSGSSFNYGVQVGAGGLYLNSGVVNGNVYSNGPITASTSGGNRITGGAISANSPSLVADQSYGSGTPSYNVSFGNSNSTEDMAQSFQISDNASALNKVSFYIKKVGSPSNATLKIVNDSSGSPGSTVLATGTLSASSVSTTYGWIDVSFSSSDVLLSENTTYWMVLDASSSSNKYYILGANSAGYSNGIGKIGQFGGSWSSTSPAGLDYFFSLYMGGINGSISGADVNNKLNIGYGGTANAQAHTVNYTNTTGSIYCASGTGNNKSCTSGTDPSYQTFPISDANITQWKSDASAGGTYSGNYSSGWAGASLGPKKISGNLTIDGGGTMTLTGPVWVTGNMTLNGGAHLKLDSSYGSNDGLIIVDGNISVSGGADATGSGTSGSYIMLISNSVSSTAATVNGGAGAMILYVPNGTLVIDGGASLKEATAYKVSITGGSSLTYESGLANLNFSSGPSGSYSVASWKETQ